MNDPIGNWLTCQLDPKSFAFSFIRITEKSKPDINITKLLQKKLLFSYRPEDYYSFYFKENATEENIRKYILEQVIPAENNQFDRNVRQGDWGEILATLIVTYFQKLVIPINKLQWKFNKDKSVFCTDLIAFNSGDKIEDIYYYEIKTRQNPNKKEGRKGEQKEYITVLAYKSLVKDAGSPTDSLLDFLARLYFELKEYETSKKFMDMINNPQRYNKKYELFLIVESRKFKSCMLDDLNSLSPSLSPLNVTIVLVDDLKNLVKNSWKDIENVLVEKYKKEALVHE